MRLIDADVLKDRAEIIPLTFDGGIDINDFEKMLDESPTVEAIPIDWIKNRIEDLYEYIGKRGRLFGPEAVANAKIHEVNVLVRLIADWADRKEE